MNEKRKKRDVDGVLLLDKPLGLSSNQALQQAKRLFHAAKAGHTGSLDPLASGLLPLCFGRATKISSYLLDADKRYLAQVRFGTRTETGDAEGAVMAHSDASSLTRETLEAAILHFVGPVRQIPPMYSALKRDGQPLYKLARQGIEVEREARDIHVHAITLTAFGAGTCELDVRCSKGTYIRTLAEDIAAAAGQCAHLGGLRRTELGMFREARMYTLAELEKRAQEGQSMLDACLIDPAQAVAHWPRCPLSPDQALRLSQGQSVRLPGLPLAAGPLALMDDAGRLLGIGEALEDGLLAPRRWLAIPD